MKALFKNKSFSLLFTGSLVSEIGNSLFGLAMSFYILDVTDSGLSMGYYLFAVIGARVLASPIAGVLVDRLNKIRVIYMTDYIRAALFIGLWAFVMTEPSQTNIFIALYVVGILSSINAAFFGPAVMASIPEIVGEDMLQQANGAQSIIASIQNIVGLLLGALVYRLFGLEWVIMANAISFGLSGFSEMFIKAKFANIKTQVEIDEQAEKSYTTDFKESLSYIKKKTGLLNLVGYSLILNFAFTPLFAIGIPFLFNNDLARVNAEFEYAYTSVAFSIAMLVAGIIVGSMKITSIYKTITKGLLALSMSFAYIALIMHLVSSGYVTFWVFYVLFLVGMVLLAFSLILTNVPLNTGLVKIVEPSYRGRVFSTIGAISGGAIPFSVLIGGAIIEFGGISMLGLFCVTIMLYPAFGFLTNKKVKSLVVSIDDLQTNARLQEAN